LLDENRLWEWLELIHEDFEIVVPIRTVRERGADPFGKGGYHMKDSKTSLEQRIRRLYTGQARVEDPPSRTVRLLSNITLGALSEIGQEVGSSFLVYREIGSEPEHTLLAGWRDDIILGTGDAMRLVRRRVNLAHAIVHTPNLALFL
jgi:3-phenylpropionate/cinnamic acid dioxygenase small subunit